MNFQIKFLKFLVFTAILLLLFAGLNAQGIYIDFGNHVISRYIHTVGTDPGNDGEIVIAQVQEEYCAQNTGMAVYFAIEDRYQYQRRAGAFNIVNVEYFDAAKREIKLIYDSAQEPDKEYATVQYFKSYQNYPNPFNQQTTIQYALSDRGHISLVIYNLAGELVKTLVDKQQAAGTYLVTWNGPNQKGLKMPSGVYIYRCISDGIARSKKMLMLK